MKNDKYTFEYRLFQMEQLVADAENKTPIQIENFEKFQKQMLGSIERKVVQYRQVALNCYKKILLFYQIN